MPTFTRQTAIPCTLQELKEGTWVQQSELPSGVSTARGLINRASIIGTVVDMQDGLVLDDGTTTMHVRSFDTQPATIKAAVGDTVLVIGKPREYNQERYILLEICKKLDPAWIPYRKKELERVSKVDTPKPVQEAPQETVEVPTGDANPFETIIAKIRELDTGEGADTQGILDAVSFDEKERLLNTLIEEGEIFELKPGKVKVLE